MHSTQGLVEAQKLQPVSKLLSGWDKCQAHCIPGEFSFFPQG